MSPTTASLQLGLATPQTATWPSLIERFQAVEAMGFDSAWIFDHFMAAGGDSVDDTYFEAWTALAALAGATSRVQIGVLVSGNTYRSPALLAKQAVTVDHISGGRLILGLGAGWHEPEHRAYGFTFPSVGERVDRFREAIQVLKALFGQERSTFEGRYYTLTDAPFLPRPVRPSGIPIIVGTRGPRMLRTVARHADVWNMVGGPDAVRRHTPVFLEACAAVGRDPATIRRSVAAWPASVGVNPLSSVQAYVDLIGQYRELGVSEVICMWSTTDDRAVVEAIAAELPTLRASG